MNTDTQEEFRYNLYEIISIYSSGGDDSNAKIIEILTEAINDVASKKFKS